MNDDLPLRPVHNNMGLLQVASSDCTSLSNQNEMISERLRSFKSMMLLLTKLPSYPFDGMDHEFVRKIDAHANDAMKQV